MPVARLVLRALGGGGGLAYIIGMYDNVHGVLFILGAAAGPRAC